MRAVADRARSIVRLELQLAALELKEKVVAIGLGLGLLAGAAIFGVFFVGFALATAAAALALVVSTWLALLIVTGALLFLVLVCAGVGVMLVRKGSPPVPKQALEEARLTTEAFKNGQG